MIRADFETKSAVNLKTHGQGAYFACPHFKPLLAAFKINGEMIEWRWPQPCPPVLAANIVTGAPIYAHNASFERQCFEWLAANAAWPLPAFEQYHCTAAQASAMALPRSLEALGDVLGLAVQKDKRGKQLIQLFSVPRRARVGDEPGQVYFNAPEDHPAEFDEFMAYCVRDVEVEEDAAARLVPLSDSEQAAYVLDQRINARGVRIDRASAHAAIRLAEKSKAKFDKEIAEKTGYVVRRVSDVANLVKWVQSQGVELNSAAKADLEALLEFDDIPQVVRDVVSIRQEAGKSSVSKITAMVRRASPDGRVRNAFIYHQAAPGRWQSIGVNFSNMPRPRHEFEDAHLDRATLFEILRREDPDLLAWIYGDRVGRPLHLLSDAIRSFIWAAPGHEFVQADYAGIEGGVIAWTSGEDWKVQALHEIIADPSLPDMYRRTAAGIMNSTTEIITKKHPLRQSCGKVPELSMSYAGGVSAFYSMSQNYGVKLDPLYEPVWGAASDETREKAVKRYENQLKRGQSRTTELSREAWLACEIIKVGWRATNPKIREGWKLREDAIRAAIRNPGQTFNALKMRYVVRLGFLWCKLPSGRCLAYASPRLRDQVYARVLCADGSWSDAEIMDRAAAEKGELEKTVRIDKPAASGISILGVDKTGKKMQHERPHGGVFAENDTQGIARDLLLNGMLLAEEHGYPVIAHTYDDIITEVPRGSKSLEFFEKLICRLPAWADGLPLLAEGWTGKRNRK